MHSIEYMYIGIVDIFICLASLAKEKKSSHQQNTVEGDEMNVGRCFLPTAKETALFFLFFSQKGEQRNRGKKGLLFPPSEGGKREKQAATM